MQQIKSLALTVSSHTRSPPLADCCAPQTHAPCKGKDWAWGEQVYISVEPLFFKPMLMPHFRMYTHLFTSPPSLYIASSNYPIFSHTSHLALITHPLAHTLTTTPCTPLPSFQTLPHTPSPPHPTHPSHLISHTLPPHNTLLFTYIQPMFRASGVCDSFEISCMTF